MFWGSGPVHAVPDNSFKPNTNRYASGVSGSRRSFGTFLSVSLATLANLLWLAWFFRDGMGPDAITTSGLGAWQNFWALAAVPVVAWVALSLAAGLRYWHAVRAAPHDT